MRRNRSTAQQLPQRRTVLGEALQTHGSLRAVGRLRPPRTPVVRDVGRKRAIHVGADVCHLIVREPPTEVQEYSLHEELGDVGVVVIGTETAPDVERSAVAIPEPDGTCGVRRARINERPQHLADSIQPSVAESNGAVWRRQNTTLLGWPPPRRRENAYE